MKIALLGLRSIGAPASGGIERVVEELSTRYAAMGHDVTVFCRARYQAEQRGSFKGVRIKALPAVYTKHLEAITNTVFAIAMVLRGYDIVHVHATGPALLSFLPRLFGRKTLVTVHGLDWKREKWGPFARFVLRLGSWAAVTFPNRTIVVSKTLQTHYREHFRKSVEHIPNGISLPCLHFSGRSESVANVPDTTSFAYDDYLLFLGRLVPEKGCHTLIKAFKKLDTKKQLLFVGAESHSQEYVRRLHELAAGDDRIVFTGPLYAQEKDAALRKAYLFVLPSTIEGMAISLLEAMSYGKACVCSDIEENLEVILPDDAQCGADAGESSSPIGYGISFETGNAEDLRSKLSLLIQQPRLVEQIGAAARDYVAAEFNWDRIAREHLEVYEATLG